MRVFVDLGWMTKENLTELFLTALDAIVADGGPTLDFRVAIDGTDPQMAIATRDLLRRVLPAGAISAYVLPAEDGQDPDAMVTILNALRRSHASSMMADVGLTVRGFGADCLPEGLPLVDWNPEEPASVLEDLVAAYTQTPPARPSGDAALDVIAETLRQSGTALDIEDLGGAFMRSARLGAEQGAPRLLVDVSYINTVDHGTGIQRVVRRMTETLISMGSGRRFDSVELVTASQFDRTELCHVSQIGSEPGALVQVHTGDTLLMLDAAWEAYPTLAPRLETFRQYGGRVVTVVYDLVPLRFPNVVAVGLQPLFERWFRAAVAVSDALVCISTAVADDVAAYIKEFDLPHRDGLRVGWWHLGSDLPVMVHETPSDDVAQMVSGETATFLMVGTVEPRKRHVIALDAMELIWARGHDVRLLILGREGWNVSELARRMREHPEAGKRLLWRTDVSDTDINHAYKRAAALLFPSESEGYGLPIVEAAVHGLGTIASDIPSSREIGGDGVIYVPVDDAPALADAILRVLGGEVLDPSTAEVLSWQQSVQQMLEVLDDDRFEYMLRT